MNTPGKSPRRPALLFVRFICSLAVLGSGSEMFNAMKDAPEKSVAFLWFASTLVMLFKKPAIGVGMFAAAIVGKSLLSLVSTGYGPAFTGQLIGCLVLGTAAWYAYKESRAPTSHPTLEIKEAA